MNEEPKACDVCKTIYRVVVNPAVNLDEAVKLARQLVKSYGLSINNVLGRLSRVSQRVHRLANDLRARGEHHKADAIVARMQLLRDRTGLTADHFKRPVAVPA